MTKIKKYSIKNPVSSDKFIGSDSENSDKTVNFSFEGVLALLNSLNEHEAISYVFSTESSGELDENGIGYFISENNIIDPEDLTKIIVSKSIVSGIDLSELFTYMGVNKANFVLKLRNISDPNNFIYLDIVSVTEEEFSFSFSVSVNETGGFLGELVDTKMYSFSFEIMPPTVVTVNTPHEIIATSAQSYTIPSDFSVSSININRIPAYKSEWSQLGTLITFTGVTIESGDKITFNR